MTREEAIKYFKRHLDLYCVDGISREAEEMAIQALKQNESAEEWYKLFVEKLDEQEPTDAISRILKRMWNCRGKHTTSIDKVKMEQIIRDELSVTQKPNFCASCKHNTDNEICLECEYDGITRGMTRYESVTHKSGKWIRVTDKAGHLVWECDKCSWQQRFNTNFCPDCGARMESEENNG